MAKKNKRNDGYLSIRKKLIAAIAMLLVASFMVASSSYAWFTLSTAPEVKGIQTAVGANGSLEIALRTEESVANITSGVGDSGDYTTWGNLIDVSATTYGLQNVTLLPARLNITSSGTLNTGSPLKTPVYGADGRIESLKEAIYGSFNTKENQFMTYDATTAIIKEGDKDVVYQNQYGVRAIGNSTAMSAQQIDFLNAQYTIALALSTAQTYTSQSLTIAGGDLANIAADKGLGAGTGPYDITNVGNMLAKLEAAVAQLDAAALAFCKAQYASTWTGSGENANYSSDRDTKFAATADLATLVGEVAALRDFWIIRDYIATAVTAAKTAYTASGFNPAQATYEQVNGVLGGLVDMSTIQLNGYTMEQAKLEENRNKIANDVAGGKGVIVTLQPKANANGGAEGVYVDMAKLVGNYSAAISVNISVGGLNLTGIKATMKTDIPSAPTVNLATEFAKLDAPSASGSTGGSILNDLYGYALDLAFRTNATGSYLMLQTTATDRIYSTGGSQATQGGGSSMTFTSVSTSFTTAQVTKLMQNIRIVFTDMGGKILAVAGLDTTAATVEGTEVTAPMKVYNPTTYEFAADGKFTAKDSGLAFAAPNEKGATQLLPLTQNEATGISVYVYLDGDYVENKDVANAAASMTGTMNLQFSSSADLKPMSYAPLQDVAGNNANTQVTPNEPEVQG